MSRDAAVAFGGAIIRGIVESAEGQTFERIEPLVDTASPTDRTVVVTQLIETRTKSTVEGKRVVALEVIYITQDGEIHNFGGMSDIALLPALIRALVKYTTKFVRVVLGDRTAVDELNGAAL